MKAIHRLALSQTLIPFRAQLPMSGDGVQKVLAKCVVGDVCGETIQQIQTLSDQLFGRRIVCRLQDLGTDDIGPNRLVPPLRGRCGEEGQNGGDPGSRRVAVPRR